jgi:hypothetical protein
MSHFTSLKVNFKVACEKDLVAALEVQFGAGTVEVHEAGSALVGYQGDDRAKLAPTHKNYAPECHLVIRRANVGEASNDVGYRRVGGGYEAYISEYDQEYNYKKEKQDKVAQDYTARVAEKKLKSQGYTLKRTIEKNGTIKLVATRYS